MVLERPVLVNGKSLNGRHFCLQRAGGTAPLPAPFCPTRRAPCHRRVAAVIVARVPPLPLADIAFSLVGPGRVGKSLAAWLAAAGGRSVTVAGRAELRGLATAGQDLLLLAVPDAALPEVVAGLA